MTPEHRQARVGRVTASRVHDIIATVKSGGYGAGRKNYLAELVAERLTGTEAPSFQSAAMLHGIECEAEARDVYAFERNVDIVETGFVPHPFIVDAGCSPDGLVGGDGLIEIKCPNTATHIDTLLGGKVPIDYATQMQFQMACTGRRWCDWISYDPRMPEHMRMVIRRVMRDDAIIEAMDAAVVDFLLELNKTVDMLQKRYPAPAEAA
jgi:predicted phage-related endonuclease